MHAEQIRDEEMLLTNGGIDATLPINVDGGVTMDERAAGDFGARLSENYCSAVPYPHIVIDNFLPKELVESIWNRFPVATAPSSVAGYENPLFEHRKRQVLPRDCGAEIRQIFGFFNSAPMLHFLEGLTTIDGLIPDPYFDGGGFHEISKGGRLGLHADFRINRKLKLNRRLNLLIYLNKDWLDAYGGSLEMWDRSAKRRVKSISPIFNRCVIFNTDKDSYHGHPEPLDVPPALTRKSMALYYYTASHKVYEETPNHGTVFAARPDDSLAAKRSAFQLKLRTYFSVSEILPPILYRNLRSLKRRMRSGAGR